MQLTVVFYGYRYTGEEGTGFRDFYAGLAVNPFPHKLSLVTIFIFRKKLKKCHEIYFRCYFERNLRPQIKSNTVFETECISLIK